MISYGPGLIFPDAWGGRPEEELEEPAGYAMCDGCGCALNDREMVHTGLCCCCRREREDDR